MLIENNAARISAARLQINESTYVSLLATPQVIVDHALAVGQMLGDLTKDETVIWNGTRTLVSGPFRLEVDHPFSTTSIVVESTLTSSRNSTISLWNLTGKMAVVKVAGVEAGSFWINPLCGMIKCAAYIRLMEHVATLPLTATQRAEYMSSKLDIESARNQLTSMAPAVFRLPEEYISVLAAVIYVRRVVAVPADGAVFTVVQPSSLPTTVASTMAALVGRTKNDVKALYPAYDLTSINEYLDSVGVTAWLDQTFSWIAISNASTFTRELSAQSAAFVVQEYDKYAFIVSEFAEWYNGNVTYDAAAFAGIINSLTVVLNRLGGGVLAIVPSAQHRSLLSVCASNYDVAREQQLAICAGVDLLRRRIQMSLTAPVSPSFAEASELAVLNTLMQVPFFDWPAMYKARLVFANDQLTYQVGGVAERVAILEFEGNSEYKAWAIDLFNDIDSQEAAREMWLSLVTMAEIVVTMLAAASVVYYNVGDTKYARIEARYSKLYSKMMHYVNSPTDTMIVPVRRFP